MTTEITSIGILASTNATGQATSEDKCQHIDGYRGHAHSRQFSAGVYCLRDRGSLVETAAVMEDGSLAVSTSSSRGESTVYLPAGSYTLDEAKYNDLRKRAKQAEAEMDMESSRKEVAHWRAAHADGVKLPWWAEKYLTEEWSA